MGSSADAEKWKVSVPEFQTSLIADLSHGFSGPPPLVFQQGQQTLVWLLLVCNFGSKERTLCGGLGHSLLAKRPVRFGHQKSETSEFCPENALALAGII
jgi:hypothetical protein